MDRISDPGNFTNWSFREPAERPSPITASFISSLNETIDLEGKRIAAKRNHVPGAVWLLLLCAGGLRLVAGQLPSGNCWASLVLVAMVIMLITDIDWPQGGLISLDERPVLELNETLNASSTATTR